MHTALAFIVVLAQAQSQPANPQAKVRAKALLGEGAALYDNGDIAGALEKFRAAYRAFPSPKILFNIGQANRDLARPVEAMEAFERFVAEAKDAPSDALAEARKSIAELRGRLGQMDIQCATDGAEVSVDGKLVGVTPFVKLLWAVPGAHQVTVQHAGFIPAVETAHVVVGGTATVTVVLRSLDSGVKLEPELTAPPAVVVRAPVTTTESASGGWWLGRKWTWVAAGSAVVFGGVATVAGLSMQNRFDELNKSCGSKSDSRPGCKDAEIGSVEKRQTIANVFWALTGAAAVTAGALFYVEGHGLSVTPAVTDSSVGLAGSARF